MRQNPETKWTFYYTEEDGVETFFGEKVCKEPNRTKMSKSLRKFYNENANVTGIGWTSIHTKGIRIKANKPVEA